MTQIEGVEVYRTKDAALRGDTIKFVANIVALCEHLPVVQSENGELVMYAIRPGLIRKVQRSVVNV